MAGARAGSGDFTGKQKEKLAKEHAKEQAERKSQVSMATAVEDERKAVEVVDYSKEKQAPAPKDDGPVDLTVTADDTTDATIERIVAGNKKAPAAGEVGGDTDLTAPKPTKAAPVVTEVQRRTRRVRARANLPMVTVGRGTSFDFEEGRTYIVPPHVAAHLGERDLVDILD